MSIILLSILVTVNIGVLMLIRFSESFRTVVRNDLKDGWKSFPSMLGFMSYMIFNFFGFFSYLVLSSLDITDSQSTVAISLFHIVTLGVSLYFLIRLTRLDFVSSLKHHLKMRDYDGKEFNVYDTVWTIDYGKPVEKKVYAVVKERSTYCEHVELNYRLVESYMSSTFEKARKYDAEDVFATKEECIEHMISKIKEQ